MSRPGRLLLLTTALAALGAIAVALVVAVAVNSISLAVPPAEQLLAACRRLLLPALSPAALLVLALAAFSTAVVARPFDRSGASWQRTAAITQRSGRWTRQSSPAPPLRSSTTRVRRPSAAAT